MVQLVDAYVLNVFNQVLDDRNEALTKEYSGDGTSIPKPDYW